MHETLTVNGQPLSLIFVEGGTFLMGDANGRDTAPVHPVTLSSFYIGQYQVTQALWTKVMGSNPSHFDDPALPVESVTLSDCHAFLLRLNRLTGRNFRLPTEAEWEYAARGGKYGKGSLYAGSDCIDEVGFYDNVDRPQPVGRLKPNELGIYDMSGNVCEWCEDIYAPYQAAPQTNPRGAAEGGYHLARGGGWNRGPHMCKVTDRGNYRPEYASNAVGLRLVMDGES